MPSPHRTAAALLVAIGAVGTAAGVVAQDRVERGRDIAEAACQPCHAIGRSGMSPNVKAPPFREIAKRYPPESLEEALAEGIVTGHPEMPQVRMSGADIGAFISYLKTLRSAK